MKKLRNAIVFALIITIVIVSFSMYGSEDNVTTVRVWTADGANKLDMTAMVDEFNRTIGKEKGIKIEYRVIRDGIDDALDEAFAKGDPPEIFGSNRGQGEKRRKSGGSVPITALSGGKEYLDGLGIDLPYVQIPGTDEYGVYGYKVRIVTGRLIYNKDLFRKAGIVDENGVPTPPETWDEFVEYSKRIHDRDRTKFGTALPFKEVNLHPYNLGWAMEESFSSGYEFDFETKTCKNVYAEAMLDVLSRLKKDGSCFPAMEKLDNDTLRHQFAEGNIGMFFACSWDVGVLTEQFPAKCDWAVADYPTLKRGERYPSKSFVSTTMSISSSALKSEKMQRAVVEVHKWYYSDETILNQYQAEQWIPYNEEITKKADPSKLSDQWMAFCKEPEYNGEKDNSISVNGGVGNDIYIDAWCGKISFDDALKEINKKATEAFRKAIEDGTVRTNLKLP